MSAGAAVPGPDPVLLLHGQPGGARDWSRVIAAIAGRNPTIAVDRPGWDGRTPPTDVTGNARAALEALDATGTPQATIVGHSFGAAAACLLAVEHPERVSALVLAAPAANVASLYAVDRLLGAPLIGDLASSAAVAIPGLVLSTSWGRRRVAARLSLNEEYLEAVGRAFRTPSAWRAFATEQRALLHELPALEPRLGEIVAPTEIIVGTADLIVPVHAVEKLATQIPTAQLTVLEGASHLLPLQHAAELAELIVAAGGGGSSVVA